MSFLFLYDKLSRKPKLFKSFTVLTIEEFDNVYSKIKKYEKHEIQHIKKVLEKEGSVQADISI